MELIDLLLIVLSIFAARAFSRIIGGIMEGISRGGVPPAARQSRSRGVPQQGVQMARDPVCGTYVVPDHAVSLNDVSTGRGRVFFCSDGCRDQYRAHGVQGAKSA